MGLEKRTIDLDETISPKDSIPGLPQIPNSIEQISDTRRTIPRTYGSKEISEAQILIMIRDGSHRAYETLESIYDIKPYYEGSKTFKCKKDVLKLQDLAQNNSSLSVLLDSLHMHFLPAVWLLIMEYENYKETKHLVENLKNIYNELVPLSSKGTIGN